VKDQKHVHMAMNRHAMTIIPQEPTEDGARSGSSEA